MRACFLAIAALLIVSGVGCRGMNLAHNNCDCGGHGGGGHGGLAQGGQGGGGHGGGGPLHAGTRGTPGFPHHHQSREYAGPQGPSTAQVGYPYYTTRGPRDFLVDNPPTIGR
ncbi:MAG: hypothetical protein WD872_08030 [Pirellulaceae bacterium]